MTSDQPQASTSMSWKQLSFVQKVFLCWMFLASILVVWCLFGADHFFVSGECFHYFLYPLTFLGVVYSILYCYSLPRFSQQAGPYADKIRKMNPFIKYVLMPPMMAGFLVYLPLAQGVPSLLHLIFRSPYSQTDTVESKMILSSRGHHCNLVKIKELDNYWFGELCVSDSAYDDLKPNMPINLYGTKSWFGIDITDYTYTYHSDGTFVIGPRDLDFLDKDE